MSDPQRNGVSRRAVLLSGGAALAAASAPALGENATNARSPRQGGSLAQSDVTLREGTNIASAASPDGRWIAFDLLGILWVVSAEAGVARRLTDDFGDIAQPDWSPDGETLCFQSYRSGNFHIWTIRPDGSGLQQWTGGPHDCREPRFSPDGRWLAFSSDRSGGRYAIHALDLATGETRVVSTGNTQDSEPAWVIGRRALLGDEVARSLAPVRAPCAELRARRSAAGRRRSPAPHRGRRRRADDHRRRRRLYTAGAAGAFCRPQRPKAVELRRDRAFRSAPSAALVARRGLCRAEPRRLLLRRELRVRRPTFFVARYARRKQIEPPYSADALGLTTANPCASASFASRPAPIFSKPVSCTMVVGGVGAAGVMLTPASFKRR